MLNQQPLIVAMQLGDFILAHHGALLGLAQFCLYLLQLAFMAALFLFALLLDGIAVMLQRIPGMQVLFFQRTNLLVLVVDP